MNIFFLVPFLLVASIGIYQDSFAIEIVTGYDYFDTTNPDGTHTWSSHEPYVFDGTNWVPYIATGTTIQTDLAIVTLNADGTFVWNGKFTDKIVAKYSDVTDQVTWTYPNTLNNDVPVVSWDGNQLVSSKVKSGIGQLDYKYILTDGKWKTQLEATNLSSLNTKVFGFDQIIDLESDMIKFGKVTRNLDNFHGQTFNKQFLIDNKGKVLDLLNDIEFDFDLGFDNLYSITVYDTGANKSRLVFDYRTTEILLPGQTLIIDPTFGYANASGEVRVQTNNSISVNCGTSSYSVYGGGEFVFLGISTNNEQCIRLGLDWDVSAIIPGITVTNVNLRYDVTGTPYSTRNCSFNDMTVTRPSTSGSPGDIYLNIGNGTNFVSNDAGCTTIANNKVLDLGPTADSSFTTHINSGRGWVGVGVKLFDETRGASNYGQSEAGGQWELEITYNAGATSPPNPVTSVTYANLGPNSVDVIWDAPNSFGSGTFQTYVVNSTTPWGAPLTFNQNSTSLFANVTGLTFGTDYSFRIAAATEIAYNTTGSYILNITTTSITYTTPPILTAFGPSSSPTQIDLQFPGSTMQNINGYRIQRETPINTGWTTIVSNTTNTNTFYNNTGLTSNIIYNYRVYALNGTGISTASNTYAMTTFHLPNAVTDLTGTATDLSTIDLSWSTPTSYAPAILGYQINGTTPTGEPVDVLNSNTGTTATTATVLNLLIGNEYSFRISPITVHGLNASGNIWNGSTVATFVIGNLSSPDVTNDDDFSIFFDRTDLNSSAIQLDVTYPNSYNLSCDFKYKYARTNQTYSGLASVPNGTDNQVATFTLINATGDLVQVRCWDILTGDESTYIITITDFPFLQQIQSLRNGDYGTFFQIGAFDGVMLIIIFLGMVGLNRTTPIVGVIFVVITVFTMQYFGLITYPIIMYPAMIMMIVWAFVSTRKDD